MRVLSSLGYPLALETRFLERFRTRISQRP
jgi:hypothetical protein